MARYHVEAKHTKEQCLADLDKMAEAPQVLDQFEWGCMAGDHTGYATLEAGSEQEAMNMLPDDMRSRAHIVPVNKITPEQIKSFHQQM